MSRLPRSARPALALRRVSPGARSSHLTTGQHAEQSDAALMSGMEPAPHTTHAARATIKTTAEITGACSCCQQKMVPLAGVERAPPPAAFDFASDLVLDLACV